MDASWSRSGCTRTARVRFARAARARSRAGEGRAKGFCATWRPRSFPCRRASPPRSITPDRSKSSRGGRRRPVVASRRSGASRAPCAGSGRTRGGRGRPKDRLGQSSGSFRSRNGRERRRPVLALWLSERGWRAPVEARPAVGQPMPLGLAPVPVRALTLVAIRDLFGEEVMALEGAPARAPWLFRRAAPRRPVPAKSPRPSALWPGAERRSPADHRLLPQEILAHPDWAAAAQLPERRRRRLVSTADRRGPRAGFREAIAESCWFAPARISPARLC